MEYHRGYTINQNVWEYDGEEDYLNLNIGDSNSKLTISALNSMTFDRIKKFCDERGIEIIIYSMPSAKNYNQIRIDAMEAFAKEKGVTYIDLNGKADELGIDWTQDTNDGGDHMNLNGARKVVKYFGNYFRENLNLTDHRGDPSYSDWDEELVEYDKLVEEMDGKSYLDIYTEKKNKEWDEKWMERVTWTSTLRRRTKSGTRNTKKKILQIITIRKSEALKDFRIKRVQYSCRKSFA